MLHAILKGKARRVSLENNASQSWRSVFQHYEDLLTAAFWGRISYLSPESMNNFLASLLNFDISSWGEFESIVFWPKYDFPNPVDESVHRWIDNKDKFAEPDIVLNFEQATLIVEVKPLAGGLQYQQQWCKEIYGWKNNEEQKSALHFLALGNLPNDYLSLFAEVGQALQGVTFHGLEWDSVRAKLQHPENAWSTRQDQRIIDDCLSALALYGIRAPLQPWQPLLDFLATQTLPADFSFLQGKQ